MKKQDPEKFQLFQKLWRKFLLNIEDDVAGFLWILIKKEDDGILELNWTRLID